MTNTYPGIKPGPKKNDQFRRYQFVLRKKHHYVLYAEAMNQEISISKLLRNILDKFFKIKYPKINPEDRIRDEESDIV